MSDLFDQRILVLADQGNENPVLSRLRDLGHVVQVCEGLSGLAEQIQFGLRALVLPQPTLRPDVVKSLLRMLSELPEWSRMPMVVVLQADAEVENQLEKLSEKVILHLLESEASDSQWTLTLKEVTRAREAQYRIRDLQEQLQDAQNRALEAARAKSEFLANMSHEIHTPLGAVLGFCELLADGKSSEEERALYLAAVRRNGQQLADLISDLLDLARVEAGRIEIEPVNFPLSELLQEVLAGFQVESNQRSLPIVIQRADDVPERLRGDRARFVQILKNVIGNALKFTGHGLITVRVGGAVSGAKHFNLRVEVEDTGIGIGSAQAEHLFEPFWQVDSSSTRSFGGTGLGLVLSRRLAVAMGGNVSLMWSLPGGGSCFAVDVHLEVVRDAEWLQNERIDLDLSNVAAAASHLPLKGRRVLVVDDSVDNQILISRLLQLWGAEVESASDGVEAVEKALGRDYNVVLMDLQMPRLSGMEATKILRDRGFKDPIVALTARNMTEDRARCLRMGCSDFVTKPIERDRLAAVLGRLTQAASGYELTP